MEEVPPWLGQMIMYAKDKERCVPGVHEHDMRGSCEVERDASSLETHEEDPDVRVMCELVNHAVPVVHAHAALQTHTLHTCLHSTQHTGQSDRSDSSLLFGLLRGVRQTMTGDAAHTEHNMCKKHSTERQNKVLY